jgi:hypothetical protein
MQCRDNKIQQTAENRFSGAATEKSLNYLNLPLQKCARDDFDNFCCCVLTTVRELVHEGMNII